MSVAVHRSVVGQHAESARTLAQVLGDFPSFCALLEIKLKKGGTRSFAYKNWNSEQKRFQASRHKSKRHIVVKPRQIGFSTLELARDLWFAVTRKAVNVLVVVHDGKIKRQLFSDLKRMAEALRKKGLLPKEKYSSVDEIVFAESGSAVRIVEAGATDRTAEGKGRSGTVHRLHATEMGFWKAAQSTWTALDASVPDDAEVVIESTANGAGGLFFDMVQHNRTGAGQYQFQFFPWYEHREYRAPLAPSFDPEPRDKWEKKLRALGCDDRQIQWWRNKVNAPDWGLEKTLQEYLVDADSCFRSKGRTYFEQELIDTLFDQIQEPLAELPIDWTSPETKKTKNLGTLKMYEPPRPGLQYVGGGDVSEGVAEDASAMTVREKRTGRKVATYRNNKIEPGDFGLVMAVVGRMYNEALLGPERNNHGHAALRAMTHEAKYRRDRIYRTSNGKLGWETNSATRPVMIDDLAMALREQSVTSPDRTFIAECRTLIKNERGKVEARDKTVAGGCKDDMFIADCITWQLRNAPVFEYRGVDL